MLLIKGQLTNSYIKPSQLNRNTGELSDPRMYMQVMQKNYNEDGTFVMELTDVKADISFSEAITGFLNKEVTIPISLFTPKNNQMIYKSMPKGQVPTVIQQQSSQQPAQQAEKEKAK